MTKIPVDEIRFHPVSFGDPAGRLFRWQDGLYRAIAPDRASFCRELFDSGMVRTLFERRWLVETEIAPLEMPGYGLVLKHRRIPFVSYAFEWCAAMLKEAALCVLDLERELARARLTLQDAHPWNVLFDGPRPVYVDFGSIVPLNAETVWRASNEFCQYFLYPLQMMAHGHGRVARWLLHDTDHGILPEECAALTGRPADRPTLRRLSLDALALLKSRLPFRFHAPLKEGTARVRSIVTERLLPDRWRRHLEHALEEVFDRLREEVERIPTVEPRTEWSEYYHAAFPSFDPSPAWSAKHRSVRQVFDEARPATVLDVGCNRGWYSQLAARSGARVVAFDTDETCVTRLHADAADAALPILPLIGDIRNPAPGYGLDNQWIAPATERLRCEWVLGLAIVHHLAFKMRLSLDQIVQGLSAFSSRGLLVEFIPPDDRYVSEWRPERLPEYALDTMRAALERRYRVVRVMPSDPEPRVLLRCEK